MMLFVRPARLSDLDELEQMARAAQPVLHSLPRDRRALIHASRELKVNRKIHALTMSHELTGKSRLTGFYIDPSLRTAEGEAAAHLLSRSRMLYIAANRKRFSSEVFSLMLGVTDDKGASPFWDAVGRKFFGRDFEQVESESGGRSRTFIAEVMPSYPLYVPLLPGEAQRVLGEPNESTLLAYDIHLEEGFEPDRYVDIFDAGPVLTIAVDKSASASSSELRAVRETASESGAPYLVAAGGAHEFRYIVAGLGGTRADGAALTAAARDVLGVEDKDTVRCVPLHQASGELQ